MESTVFTFSVHVIVTAENADDAQGMANNAVLSVENFVNGAVEVRANTPINLPNGSPLVAAVRERT